MNQNMKNTEEFSKQLENIGLPDIELTQHRAQLRRVLLNSQKFNENKKRKPTYKWLFSFSLAVGVLVIGLFSYLFFYRSENTQLAQIKNQANENVAPGSIFLPEAVYASQFAAYTPVEVSYIPRVNQEAVNADLSNVQNITDLIIDDKIKSKLVQNSFVAKTNYSREFFSIYENNRYNYYPSFITTDSILHNYHLYFDFLLRKTEEEYLTDQLNVLTQAMVSESYQQFQELKGTNWEAAAKKNLAYFNVAAKLLDNNHTITPEVKNEVEQELALINKHDTLTDSVVMGIGSNNQFLEDYTQYIPRGHYDKSEELQAYFKAMMWYGRLTFRFKYPDEVKSSALITLALSKEENLKMWDAIYEPTNFFVGKSDDINYYQFMDIMRQIYGEDLSLTSLQDNTKFSDLVSSAQALEPPKLNSMPIYEQSQQSDREADTKGFRFMGQRYTLDADIFQNLICRSVGNQHGTKDCGGEIADSRMLPKGLDVTAAMGSETAYNILEQDKETTYFNYPENMQKIKDYISGLDTDTWTQNLYWGWLYTLKPLNETKTEGYPTFMQNNAWNKKQLNTYLGNWTELKHDTILYSKQVYAEMGGGEPPQAQDDRGYVEPSVEVYARLTSLLNMTKTGLAERSLISDENKINVERLSELTLSLKNISEKELNNEKLSDDDYELIRTYGGQLEHFWIEVNKEEMEKSGMPAEAYLFENPAAIVADVATDPNGQVLEEATGLIDNIFVIVPIDGKLRIAKGGIYSYYEFAWPMNDRLTDKKWQEMLNSDDMPEKPNWTVDYFQE